MGIGNTSRILLSGLLIATAVSVGVAQAPAGKQFEEATIRRCDEPSPAPERRAVVAPTAS